MTREVIDNLIVAPIKFHRDKDARRTNRIHHLMARETWHELLVEGSEYCDASPDFADGFETGYVDYLTYGGTTLPPVIPPRQYWHINQRYSDANSAGRDWLAGFEFGAKTARGMGIREGASLPATGIIAPEFPDEPPRTSKSHVLPPEPAPAVERITPSAPLVPVLPEELDSESLELDEPVLSPANDRPLSPDLAPSDSPTVSPGSGDVRLNPLGEG